MRVPLFVFIGLSNTKTINHISLLHDRLNSKLNKVVPNLKANRQNNLLIVTHESARIYASILKEQKDIDDWIKMANDFELTVDLNELNNSLLEKRLDSIKDNFPNLYKDIHYTLTRVTFEVMNQFSDLTIYAFL